MVSALRAQKEHHYAHFTHPQNHILPLTSVLATTPATTVLEPRASAKDTTLPCHHSQPQPPPHTPPPTPAPPIPTPRHAPVSPYRELRKQKERVCDVSRATTHIPILWRCQDKSSCHLFLSPPFQRLVFPYPTLPYPKTPESEFARVSSVQRQTRAR